MSGTTSSHGLWGNKNLTAAHHINSTHANTVKLYWIRLIKNAITFFYTRRFFFAGVNNLQIWFQQ